MTARLIFQISAQKTFMLRLDGEIVTLGRAADNAAKIDEASIRVITRDSRGVLER